MKIAIDIREAGGEKAGKGQYTFNLVQALLNLDKNNRYILYTKEKIAGFEEFNNAKIRHIEGRSIFWHRKVAKDAKNEGVNVFFAPTSYIIPSILHRDIISMFTVHDLVAFIHPAKHNKKANIIERLYLRKALKKAKAVISISENTKKDLEEKFKAQNVHVIHNAASKAFKPVPKSELADFIRKTRLPKNFFLAVGTLIPRKNYVRLIRAFALFRKDNPGYHLIIVGKKGWNYREIENAIKENHLSGEVHILGYLTEKSLAGLYSLATALVFPSLYEGFGIPPLEAMQCGCPVIAGNTSSIPEVVGDAGIMIDPNSSEEIATAMQKITEDQALREDLIGRGYTQSKKFSWEYAAKELLEMMANICHNTNH